jgi:D-alanine-D-alanine ligase
MGKLILLFGGDGSEHRVSVASAMNLCSYLEYDTDYWFWSRNGSVWLVDRKQILDHPRPFENDFAPFGLPRWRDLPTAINCVSQDSVVFLALHGGSGENGTVQSWLEAERIRFTGSSAAASALAFDKKMAKEVAANAGASTAESDTVSGRDLNGAAEILRRFLKVHGRLVLKPVADGSSSGLMFVEPDNHSDAIARLSEGPDVVCLSLNDSSTGGN